MNVKSEGAASARKESPALVIGASSLGTVFEWYDFFLYAAVATIITQHFFSAANETTGYIFALLAFAAGFAVRPLGAFIFGRLGDLWGRRNTFLVTMFIMGVATVAIGVIPTAAQIGVWAPILLVAARLLQGLAMGGEYGGAAVYVAEHAPEGKRGLYTSFIQVTATAGLALSLLAVLATRNVVGAEEFAAWGWRIPFVLSVVLLLLSMWIRLSLSESPLFQRVVAEGKRTPRPLAEAFGKPKNLAAILVAFALCVGMTVVWYTSQFYSLFFLERVLKVESGMASSLVATALIIASPLFVFFGWLSDKVGRKPVILAGCLLAAITLMPLFQALTAAANPALYAASQRAPVSIAADRSSCSLQFDPIGKSTFRSSCDIATSYLARAGVGYTIVGSSEETPAVVRVGEAQVPSFIGEGLSSDELAARRREFGQAMDAALANAGYPPRAASAEVQVPMVLGILVLLIAYATMCYGPLAAALAEMFPTRIRYTAVSVPYNLAVGWIGGFLPAAAFAMVASNGNPYFGLWYPIAFAAAAAVIGLVFARETNRTVLAARDDTEPARAPVAAS